MPIWWRYIILLLLFNIPETTSHTAIWASVAPSCMRNFITIYDISLETGSAHPQLRVPGIWRWTLFIGGTSITQIYISTNSHLGAPTFSGSYDMSRRRLSVYRSYISSILDAIHNGEYLTTILNKGMNLAWRKLCQAITWWHTASADIYLSLSPGHFGFIRNALKCIFVLEHYITVFDIKNFYRLHTALVRNVCHFMCVFNRIKHGKRSM